MHFATVDSIKHLINLKREHVVYMEGAIKQLEEHEDQKEHKRKLIIEKVRTELEINKLEDKLERLKSVA